MEKLNSVFGTDVNIPIQAHHSHVLTLCIHAVQTSPVAHTRTYVHTPLRVSSHKHGGRHKAFPAADMVAVLGAVLGVAVCAHVRRRDLVVSGVIPARGGSSVIMLPLIFNKSIIVMVGVQVLAAKRHTVNMRGNPSSFCFISLRLRCLYF